MSESESEYRPSSPDRLDTSEDDSNNPYTVYTQKVLAGPFNQSENSEQEADTPYFAVSDLESTPSIATTAFSARSETKSLVGDDFSDAGSLADEKEFQAFLERGEESQDPARELELASAALQAEQSTAVNSKARAKRNERDELALFRNVTAHLAHNSFDNTLLVALGKIPGFPANTDETCVFCLSRFANPVDF